MDWRFGHESLVRRNIPPMMFVNVGHVSIIRVEIDPANAHNTRLHRRVLIDGKPLRGIKRVGVSI